MNGASYSFCSSNSGRYIYYNGLSGGVSQVVMTNNYGQSWGAVSLGGSTNTSVSCNYNADVILCFQGAVVRRSTDHGSSYATGSTLTTLNDITICKSAT